MAASSIGREGFHAIISEGLEDPISFEPLSQAVTVIPCGHVFNENTVLALLAANPLCPLDRSPIERHIPNYTVRNLVELLDANQEEHRASSPTPEAREHYATGKELVEQRDYERAIVALLEALRLSPAFEKAQSFLDLALSRSIEQNHTRAVPPSTEESYLDLLFRLTDQTQGDPELQVILERQINQLMDGGRLSPTGERAENWMRRLLSTTNDIRIFVADKLKEIYSSPASSSDHAIAGPSNPNIPNPENNQTEPQAGMTIDASTARQLLTEAGSFEALAHNSPNLTSIDLRQCSNITDAGLEALASNCPNLTSIDLSQLSQCTNPTTTDLSQCSNITGAGLAALASNCPNLTAIHLSGRYNITDAVLEALASNSPNLTTINLSGCSNLTDGGLGALASNCPNLTTINLRECGYITGAGLAALASNCPNLTTIHLSGRYNITDAVLEALASNSPNLTTINLSGCKNLTGAGLGALARNCPNLTTIDLRQCSNITDAGLEALASNCPNLTTIEVCNNITDAGLEVLASNCPNLTKIGGCDKITDAGLEALARSCPNLTTIYLDGCKNITDVGLEALARSCPNLTTINLYGCDKITDVGLEALARSCPNLNCRK